MRWFAHTQPRRSKDFVRLSDVVVETKTIRHSGFSRHWMSLVGLAAASVALSGCSSLGGTTLSEWLHNGMKVGHDYLRPAAQISDRWIDADDPRVLSQSRDYSDWWRVFNDPAMESLVYGAYQQNLPLREAGLRVLEARAQRQIAVGALFPQQQQAIGQYERIQISNNGLALPFSPAMIGALPRSFDFWSTGFQAAWELDVWGRFRRNVEAADADLDKSIEDYDAILVCLIAETAATYVDIRTVQQRLEFARANVTAQEGSLRIARSRFDNGAVTELDVTQATSNLKETEALVPQLETALRQANNRLCILLGIPTRDLTTELGTAPIPIAPEQVAVGIPAELLRRRPDVRAAERRVAAQSARVGIAVSDLYPHFALSGSLRVDSNRFKDLFEQASTAGFVGPSFNWDVLNYGRIRNHIRAQEARLQQLIVNYENEVLRANKDVEDGLVGFLKAREVAAALAESVQAAERSVELALIQYRDGAVDFNRVFNLQSLLTQSQDRLATARGQIAGSLILTYKALGGGWEIRYGRPLQPQTDEAIEPPGEQEELPPAAEPEATKDLDTHLVVDTN